MSPSQDILHVQFPHCTHKGDDTVCNTYSKGDDTVYNTYNIIRLYTIQLNEVLWWADNGAGMINPLALELDI